MRSSYDQDIEEAIDSLDELLKRGEAGAAIDLTEHALRLLEPVIELVDDSDGWLGGILERVQSIHHQACQTARPDPKALARRLFEWELHSNWDVFHNAMANYADILGEPGLVAYRELAEAEWARLPALKPDGDHRWNGVRYRITSIMESLARRRGDVDALIAIKSRDLSSAYAFLDIAETCKAAGRPKDALAWAERGLQAFPTRTDGRLREFLANEYHGAARPKHALAIMWSAFAETPTLRDYQNLKRHADTAREWPAWRERALAHVRERIAEEKRAEARPPGRSQARTGPLSRVRYITGTDHSELVRIFLWERKVEAAWTEAVAGGCDNVLWLALAAKREKTHPQEVLPVYQAQVEPVLMRTNQRAYEEAVELLRTIERIMQRLGKEAEFARHLQALRVAHKPKRNFMKLLDHTFR